MTSMSDSKIDDIAKSTSRIYFEGPFVSFLLDTGIPIKRLANLIFFSRSPSLKIMIR